MDLTVAVYAALTLAAVVVVIVVLSVRALFRNWRAARQRPTPRPAPAPAPAAPTVATVSVPAPAAIPVPPSTTPASPPARIRIPIGSGDDIADDFDFDIVGEGSYLGTLRRAAGDRLMAGETVVLPVLVIPEPNNKYDPNAIAVHLEGFGKVGYFQKDTAVEWADVSRALVAFNADGTCEGLLMGGDEDRPNIGVRLSLDTPQEALDRIGAYIQERIAEQKARKG